MPKIKTRKSAVKRFHETATGKLMFRHTGRAHSMVSKSPGRKRHLYREGIVDAGKNKVISRQLPTGSNY